MVELGARGVMDGRDVQDFRLSLRELPLEVRCFLITLWDNGTPLRSTQAANLWHAAMSSYRQRGLKMSEKRKIAVPRPVVSR